MTREKSGSTSRYLSTPRRTLAAMTVLLGLLLTATNAQLDPTLKTHLGKNATVYVEMSTEEHTTLRIKAIFPKASWFGIGFGTEMTNAELVMMLGHSDESLQRVISTSVSSHTKPPIPIEPAKSYPAVIKAFNETHNVFEVTRELDTKVEGEAVIKLNEKQPMLYSFRFGDLNTDADIKKHQERGYWGIIVRGDGAVVLSADPPFDFYELHGFMMWAAWGVLGWI